MGLTEVQIAKATRIALRAVNGGEKKVCAYWSISPKQMLFLISAKKHSYHYIMVEVTEHEHSEWQASILFDRERTLSDPVREDPNMIFKDFGG